MANLEDRIGPDDGLVGGDRLDVQRTTTDLPAGRTVSTAWFTVREEDDDGAAEVFEKEITDSDVAAQGVISDPGSGSGDDRSATVLFRLQETETEGLEPDEDAGQLTYWFWVRFELDNGTTTTPFKGKIVAAQGGTAPA